MSIDVGFTHIALSATDLDRSIDFYSKFANMCVIHERIDAETAVRVIWLSDKTRPFVIVLLENKNPDTILKPLSHLGVGCVSKEALDTLCNLARFRLPLWLLGIIARPNRTHLRALVWSRNWFNSQPK
jgi:catechol 2,3-dioxygenase-like lactoylglutathione lyase family enzyme